MLVCSFVAGSSARTITSPLDVAKIIIAVHKSAKTVFIAPLIMTSALYTKYILNNIFADDLGHGASHRRVSEREPFPFLVQRQRHCSLASHSIFGHAHVGDAVADHVDRVQKSQHCRTFICSLHVDQQMTHIF